MVRWLVLFACACGRVSFDPIANASVDGSTVDTTPCTGSSFGPEVVIAELDTGTPAYDPTESADRRELYFVYDGGATNYDLFVATRASASEPYGTPLLLPFNAPERDADPAITADGLVLTFTSQRTGSYRVFQSTRATTADSFTTATVAPGLEMLDVFSHDLSSDGLTIYLGSQTGLYAVSRATRQSAFGAPRKLTDENTDFPAISDDELEVISHELVGFYRMYRQTRADRSGLFGGRTMISVPNAGADPDLSADGRRLLFVSNGAMAISSRICD